MSLYNIAGSNYTPSEIRAWAKIKGYVVNPRGRLNRDVIEAFTAEKESKLPRKPEAKKRYALGGKTERKGAARKVPPCPVHRGAMVIQPELGYWKCPEDGCKLRAWPEDGGTKPLIGTGKISIIHEKMKTGQDKFFLRSDNGVLMEISRVMSGPVDIEYSGGAAVATIELILNLES